MSFVIAKVKVLPEALAPDTWYAVETENPELFDFYVSNKTGTSARKISNRAETLKKVLITSDEAPAFPCESPFWMDSNDGVLYMQYDDGDTVNWVEALSSIAVPEFAGSGEASTMARSDHNHGGSYILNGGNHEW